ncbi:MAG: patatin-like phospholipase family protein [Candidatus Sulfotelmatobacter sp.]
MKPRIALALSGGGFRASIFHLGMLRRLAELGWLPEVDVISTVSGGSIVGAFAVQRWNSFLAAGGDAKAFESLISTPFVERVQEHNFLLKWLVSSWRWPFRKISSKAFTRTQAATELLDEIFFDGQRCDSLPSRPVLIINATNLQSIRAWRFTNAGMGDSRVGHANWGTNALRLSVCVGASAAFPPVFPPLRIVRGDYTFTPPIYQESPLPEYPLIPLTDGGAYDNSGLEALTKTVKVPGHDELIEPADLLVVSDGGAPANYEFDVTGIPALSDAALLYRVDAIARQQVSALRTRSLMAEFARGNMKGIFAGIASSVRNMPIDMYRQYCEAVSANQQITDELLSLVRRVRTSLDRFNRIEIEALMYHAYSLTDAFAWCYRDTFADRYRVNGLSDLWRISFDPGIIATWKSELQQGAKAFRFR